MNVKTFTPEKDHEYKYYVKVRLGWFTWPYVIVQILGVWKLGEIIWRIL